VPVTLLESARQPGGRARAAQFGETRVDNGQHLLVGAYRETLRLLAVLGLRESDCFTRTPLLLHLLRTDEPLTVRAPRWPAPLHLVWALARARGLTASERRAALRFALVMGARRFALDHDTTVAALLARHRQPPRVVEGLWAPLCLATLNVAPEEASARLFLRVLRDAFARRTADSDLLFPRTDLGRLFPEPAVEFVRRHGGEVRLSTRVTDIRRADGRMIGVGTGDAFVPATHLVLAVPPAAAGALLAPFAAALAHDIGGLGHTPIATVYLRYGTPVRLESPMVGLVNTLTQWVIDRGDGLMAAVISGPGEHMAWEREALAKHVARELSLRLGWPAPQESFVVREKRAAFHCAPHVDERRPGAATPIGRVWLAGDYTATGYPATLEGAVRSGVECARLILHDLGP
jgi:squalene-associated FAD-dependent desaturase